MMKQTIPILKRILQERCLIVLALAGVLLAVVRPLFVQEYLSGISPDRFWSQKIRWSSCADVVLAGDSRVYINVSPQALSEYLRGRRIYNFGFSGNGYSREYLAAAENVLDPNSPSPMIVLGINPYSLTLRSLEENRFKEFLMRPPLSQSRWGVYREAFQEWFRPLPLWEVMVDLCRGQPAPAWYNEYYPDGWVACDRDPRDPTLLMANDRLGHSYQNNAVNETVVENLIQYIRKWRDRGIEVYGFRPPVYENALKEEDRLSGFDESLFIRQFTQAGGVWLGMDNTKYGIRTYDGHHLPREDALEFSQELGIHIGQQRTVGAF